MPIMMIAAKSHTPISWRFAESLSANKSLGHVDTTTDLHTLARIHSRTTIQNKCTPQP
jgi:hypothetical protein